MKNRFFLSRDSSCHWYVVPSSKRDEWEAWTNLDEDDEASWEAPKWAHEINGPPDAITFENWKQE